MNLIKILRWMWKHPLAGKQKIKATIRFIVWQIKSRLNPNLVPYPYATHSKLLMKRGLTGATGNLYAGLHEFEDMSFLLHFLRKEDLFVDIGANVGSYSVLAGSEIGCVFVSFEPLPSTFKILEENIKINKIEHLAKINNLGVGSSKSVIHFTSDLDTVNHVATENDLNTVAVNVVPIDGLFEINQPCLIKIDVEGFETDVLNGMVNTLSNPNLKAIIMEINESGNRYGYDESNLLHTLEAAGFKSYIYSPFKRELFSADKTEANLIFVRDYGFVMDRIKSSKKFKILGSEF